MLLESPKIDTRNHRTHSQGLPTGKKNIHTYWIHLGGDDCILGGGCESNIDRYVYIYIFTVDSFLHFLRSSKGMNENSAQFFLCVSVGRSRREISLRSERVRRCQVQGPTMQWKNPVVHILLGMGIPP